MRFYHIANEAGFFFLFLCNSSFNNCLPIVKAVFIKEVNNYYLFLAHKPAGSSMQDRHPVKEYNYYYGSHHKLYFFEVQFKSN